MTDLLSHVTRLETWRHGEAVIVQTVGLRGGDVAASALTEAEARGKLERLVQRFEARRQAAARRRRDEAAEAQLRHQESVRRAVAP